MFRNSLGVLLTWTCLFTTAITNPVRPSPCLDLVHLRAHLDLSEDVQLNASLIEAGALNITGTKSTNDVPLCRIMGSMMYGLKKNNTLLFEVWLPEASAYNGRYLSVGNGGFAGVIDYESMFTNLNTGFAVGGCDSGHKTSQNGPTKPGGYVDFMHNVDETRAWIQNSIAMFTAPAKKLTTAYYKATPKKMYYAGCSTGGAQGFALAQYHPEMFDGIYAGSPGNWYSHLILSFLWNGLASNSSDAFLSQSALNFTRDAVVSKCDAIDGVNDGLIGDPNACDFDISSLECVAGQAPTKVDNTTVCLTGAQIANVRSFYSGPKRADTGTSIYPGFALGSESEWLLLENSLWIQYGIPILQNLVFQNLSYDYRSFNWASDVDLVDQIASPLIDEISPNLTAFEKRGGKLVVTQGWADPFNAPFWPINQREEMAQIFGNGLDDWYRLFMVPGGGHCGGATSYPQMPGTWHGLDALIPWVEEDTAPAAVLASKPADGSSATRKLCPYPAKAVYVGEDQNDWDSYVCS